MNRKWSSPVIERESFNSHPRDGIDVGDYSIVVHCLLYHYINLNISLQKTVKLTGISKISGALALLLKAAIQFVMLVWFLCFKIPRPDVLLVQVIFEFLSMCIQNFMDTMHDHYQFRHRIHPSCKVNSCLHAWLKLKIMLCSNYGVLFLTSFSAFVKLFNPTRTSFVAEDAPVSSSSRLYYCRFVPWGM